MPEYSMTCEIVKKEVKNTKILMTRGRNSRSGIPQCEICFCNTLTNMLLNIQYFYSNKQMISHRKTDTAPAGDAHYEDKKKVSFRW